MTYISDAILPGQIKLGLLKQALKKFHWKIFQLEKFMSGIMFDIIVTFSPTIHHLA